MGSAPAAARMGPPEAREYVLERYESHIRYYWKSSRYNKVLYKATRYLLIALGATVTLISSLAAAGFVRDHQSLNVAFAVATPVLAAVLAIVGGMSQAFQWGAAWSDGVLTATRLEKERDRIAVTQPENLDAIKELEILDEVVMAETQGFFQRLFGSGGPKPQQPAGG